MTGNRIENGKPHLKLVRLVCWFCKKKNPYHYSTVIPTSHSLLFLLDEKREGTCATYRSISYCACANYVSMSYVTCFVTRNVDMQSKLASIKPTLSSKYLTNRQAKLCCKTRQTFPSMIFCSVRDEREPLLATVRFLIVHAQLSFSFPVSVVKNKNQNGLGHNFV